MGSTFARFGLMHLDGAVDGLGIDLRPTFAEGSVQIGADGPVLLRRKFRAAMDSTI